MISLAGRDILHSWGKFVFTGVGLGLLIGVTFTMAGVYRGMVDDGKVRLTRSGAQTRIDKCARPVKIGDRLVFALGGRLIAVEVAALGERRGPAEEARTLYAPMDAD